MKVCIVTTAFPRWNGDSRAPFIYEAAQSILKLGNKVRVIAMHNPGALQREKMDGIEVIRPRYLPDRLEILQKDSAGLPHAWKQNPIARLIVLPFLMVHTLAVALHTRDCDIIHANWTLSGASVMLTQWLHRKPYVVTVQGSDIYQAGRITVFQAISRVALLRAEKVIAISHSLADAVVEMGVPRSKVCVIPNGVDHLKFTTGDPIREPILLFVGSLIERKGPNYLLEAMPRILEAHPDVKLVVVGTGAMGSVLKQQAEALGIADNVLFTGNQTQQQVSEWMRKAKIFVLPSIEEGLGVVLLEAIASGTPCVGSRVGGIPDVIEPEAGKLCTPASPDELSAAVACLLDNEVQWQAFSKNARERAVSTFSWDVVAKKLIDLYQSIIHKV